MPFSNNRTFRRSTSIAAGVFKPDANGNANVLMPNLPKGVSAAGFGVTIEDEGGAKQPTPPILMQGS